MCNTFREKEHIDETRAEMLENVLDFNLLWIGMFLLTSRKHHKEICLYGGISARLGEDAL